MRSRIVASVLSTLFAVALCFPARADFPFMFAQIVCAPTLGYFSIRRITIMNLPHTGPYLTEGLEPGPGVEEALRRDHLIFESDGLEREPFSCAIPGFKPAAGWSSETRPAFDVKVIGHRDHDSEESSYCRIADNAEVLLNGKSIGLIVLNPCKSGETLVSIEVAHDGVELTVRKCVEPSIFDNPTGNQIACSDKPFVGGDAR
jgi:hypothetical protein